MPVGGKYRSNKRSSGNSYSSTVTTVAFVALCILGVWMLSPNSVFPLKSTTRTAASTISTTQSSSISMESRDHTKPTIKKDQLVYEDSRVDLPRDAIKPDDQSNPDLKDESSSEISNDLGHSTRETVSEVEIDNNNDKQDNNIQENGTSDLGSNSDEQNAVDDSDKLEANVKEKNLNADDNPQDQLPSDEQHAAVDDSGTDEAKLEANVKEKDLNADDNPQDQLPFHGEESVEELEKQKNFETDESSFTLNQEVEETSKEKQSFAAHDTDSVNPQTLDDHRDINEKQEADQNKLKKASLEDEQVESHESLENHEQEISEEDQQKRIEQHQKQEDDQMQQEQPSKTEMPQGETSSEQIEHDTIGVSLTDHDQMPQNPKIEHQGIHQQKDLPGDQEMKEKDKLSSKPNDNKDSSFSSGESSTIPRESKESKRSWSTQEDQSENQKERRKVGKEDDNDSIYGYKWDLCNVTAGPDYIPCLDNEKAIAKLRSRGHYEHRERHCPEEPPTCLVTLPEGYKKPIEWPHSRDKIWYSNVPHTKLAEVKGHQNWVKLTGEFLTFPGGGTQFIHGALHYIDFLQEVVPDIAWGRHTRVVLDVGCGVASFGGYLFERDVLAISFAPKDEHEAQVQFALERGIPAISAVMGTQRLPFPSKVFDTVHCARCRVPWHVEGGALLLELNRVLRPGGYFVWSATPVYQKLKEDVQIWNEMSKLTVSMCWELITIKKDKLNSVGAAIYRKPDSNECYDKRKHNHPPMCKSDDDPNASWYVPLQACMHRVPAEGNERGSEWPEEWPRRLQEPPYWLNRSQMGIYGKPAPEDFVADYEHWKWVVSKTYLSGLGISWSDVRNIMDMRAVYGGFAAALKDLKVWVINVVNVDSPDTLPIIYERGLFGIYHDWCESFSTYPRTYDLLHADHLFSRLKKRCKVIHVLAEVDRIVRPGGKFIVRDDSSTIGEVENLLKSLHWEVHLTLSKNQQGILSAQKSNWRPDSYAASS